MQLVSVYGEKGDERRQLNTMELAYLQGFANRDRGRSLERGLVRVNFVVATIDQADMYIHDDLSWDDLKDG